MLGSPMGLRTSDSWDRLHCTVSPGCKKDWVVGSGSRESVVLSLLPTPQSAKELEILWEASRCKLSSVASLKIPPLGI